MLQEELEKSLKEKPLDSTWYYQNQALAALEYSIMQELAADPYSDYEEIAENLHKQGFVFSREMIEKQMDFMSLKNKVERQIFYWLLLKLCEALTREISGEEYKQGIYDVLRAVIQEETADGKVKSYVDNFIYLPKCALVALIQQKELVLTPAEEEKFAQSKPKFAKFFFNEFLLNFTP